jgi:hypothetical protein
VNQLPSDRGYASGMPLQPIETSKVLKNGKRDSRTGSKVLIDADGVESPMESPQNKNLSFVMNDIRHVKQSASRKNEQFKTNLDG